MVHRYLPRSISKGNKVWSSVIHDIARQGGRTPRSAKIPVSIASGCAVPTGMCDMLFVVSKGGLKRCLHVPTESNGNTMVMAMLSRFIYEPILYTKRSVISVWTELIPKMVQT